MPTSLGNLPTRAGQTHQYSAPKLHRDGHWSDPTVCGASVVMPLVAGFAVAPVVVVAAPPLPVVAPARIPILAGAPVIIRERRGLGLGDGCRP